MDRCPWVTADSLYIAYHDIEWGVPLHSDQKLFELWILEGMQAGLNWFLVLKKREHFRKVFDKFDAEKIASYTTKKLSSLITDPGIIRNRKKIETTVKNARVFLDIQQEKGSFDAYIWNFVDGTPVQNKWKELSQVPCKTDISRALSKDLKRRGATFCGETIMYSFMQAAGMVNDHLASCFRWKEIAQSVINNR